ncbi:MAG: hypothetical protein ABFS42_01370 [Candidatus Krumholzibacteriota bacterium]
MARTDSGADPRRPHHISSIAHLFLEEGRPEAVGKSGRDHFHCTVAAPGGAAISAFAAAGLALGSPGPATLGEDPQVRWSVGTYFRSNGGMSRVQADPPARHRNTWTVSTESPARSAGAVTAAPQSGTVGEIRWNHLGCMGPVELSHLEALSAAPSAGPPAVSLSGGLVWCLQEKEAQRLGTYYSLGRLAEVIEPGRMEILLFPDAWSSAGRPGWLDEIRNAVSPGDDPENLARIAGLVERVCAGIPLGISPVSGQDNLVANFPRADDPDSLWRRLAVTMMSGLAEC